MNPEVTIRLASPDDAEGIAHVYIESAEHHAQLDPERYYVPESGSIVARYRERVQHPKGMRGVTLVAESEGGIVGFVDVRIERPFDMMHRPVPVCYIAEIAVTAASRGQGIGTRLMQAAEKWGRSMGAGFAALDYNVANARAAGFYHERLGYRRGAIVAVKRLE